MSFLLSLALFNCGWYCCVLGAAYGFPWLGPLYVSVWFVWRVTGTRTRSGEALLILLAAIVGYALDSTLFLSGMLLETGQDSFGWPAPLWLVCLWPNLAGALGGCLGYLKKRYFLGCVAGVIGGPMAYFAGRQLGAIDLADPLVVSFAAIAAEWAIAMPLLLFLDARLSPEPRQGVHVASSEGSLTNGGES